VGHERDVGIVDGLIGVLPGEWACGETLLLYRGCWQKEREELC